ncbi:MAG: hypothetical protein J6B09_04375 [Clostridia bacterium]|nr:hypothetical protein [Clostridia bacterium]
MKKRTPNFEHNLLRVLKGEKPERATLFEMVIDRRHYELLAGYKCQGKTAMDHLRWRIDAMVNAGYDYVTCHACDMKFRPVGRVSKSTRGLNGDALIWDWESFEKFEWPDMSRMDYSRLEDIKPYLPSGMTVMVMGPDGVLENVINLVGYDNLCMMLYDDPELAETIFNEVGSRLLTYYQNAASADTVGFICSNDDWGFNTQTFLPPDMMRKYVFPWHKKIVQTAHDHGKPCMLHSCGYYNEIIDDVINDMKFDARHSYEDSIIPVEKAYEDLNGKIAVLGGLDINFLASKTPQEIYSRARHMLEASASRGGYALGSGNSIPAYIPYENYLSMIKAAHEFDQ